MGGSKAVRVCLNGRVTIRKVWKNADINCGLKRNFGSLPPRVSQQYAVLLKANGSLLYIKICEINKIINILARISVF